MFYTVIIQQRFDTDPKRFDYIEAETPECAADKVCSLLNGKGYKGWDLRVYNYRNEFLNPYAALFERRIHG